MSLWVPSPNFYPGRRRPLAFIVWHSTESQERTGAAESVARNWFAKKSSKVSAHVVADNTGVVECVKPENTAWHCANGNAAGYGIEVVGKASQGAGWSDEYSLAAIGNACAWIRSQPALNRIPVRRLTDDQLRRHEPGHTSHLQVSRVLGGTTHTDPGKNFPWDVVMALASGDSPHAVGLPVLRYGDRSDAVKNLQQFLTRVFPTYATLAADGVYGDKTKAAVKEFQRRANVHGSPLDGTICGVATNHALAEYGYRG